MKKSRNEMIEGKLNNLAVPGWIFSDLGLKGDKALVYAALYATRGCKLLVSEFDVISRHLNICESTFHKIRAEFEKNGLIEVTADGKSRYFSVTDRTQVQTEKITKISARYEENLAARTDQPATSIPKEIPQNDLSGVGETEDSTQLGIFEPAESKAASADGDSRETHFGTAAEVSADETGQAVSENFLTLDQVPVKDTPSQESLETRPEPVRIHNPNYFTKEKFCKDFKVRYDGTEDTDGIDWYLLGHEFAGSKILKSSDWARDLKNVCENKKAILHGYYSDAAVEKRRAEAVRLQPRTDSPDQSSE